MPSFFFSFSLFSRGTLLAFAWCLDELVKILEFKKESSQFCQSSSIWIPRMQGRKEGVWGTSLNLLNNFLRTMIWWRRCYQFILDQSMQTICVVSSDVTVSERWIYGPRISWCAPKLTRTPDYKNVPIGTQFPNQLVAKFETRIWKFFEHDFRLTLSKQ